MSTSSLMRFAPTRKQSISGRIERELKAGFKG